MIMSKKKSADLKGEALRDDFIKRMKDSRANFEPDSEWDFPGAIDGFIQLVQKLPLDSVADLHSMNFGFSNISDTDFIVIRADIIVERSLRSLASAVAYNPLPQNMSLGAVKGFLRLMEPIDLPYLKAVSALSEARNIIAHEIHGDYSSAINKFFKALDITPQEGSRFIQAGVIVLISAIANRRSDWYMRRNRYDSLDAEIENENK